MSGATSRMATKAASLDPVTFEVVKNALMTTVDQMGEQILKTCHSFVIYAHDFSSALFDLAGRTVMHGSKDLAGHLGTQHFHAQALLQTFGNEMHPNDVYVTNDPYIGGTHFSDVRVMRPLSVDGEIIGFSQASGHWADIGGSVPGSFDVRAREHFGEGLRIPPVKISEAGRDRPDVVDLIVSNTRSPADAKGDLYAQAQATRVAQREVTRLAHRYGKDVLLQAFTEIQDYVELLTRRQISRLPDGTWETVDYIDSDPRVDEGMIPIRVRLTIQGDRIRYDLSDSHPVVGTFLNSAFGATHSALYAGTKMFLPEVPLNDGFFRPIEIDLGSEGSVVNAVWPTAVSGFAAGPFEKIINSVFELWSHVMPERAMACGYNIEYLLAGGRDARRAGAPIFMWYDWLCGGWGGRNGRDGLGVTSPPFGTGLTLQPLEGQERLSPMTIIRSEVFQDSAGPGRFRGGCGAVKVTRVSHAEGAVLSYSCDRARAITWGIQGGLPSLPQGVWLTPRGSTETEFLGAIFSNYPLREGDVFSRAAAGGGGYGDPLDRDVGAVLNDVADEYVSVERARRDYGVVILTIDIELCRYVVDEEATVREREAIRSARAGWLEEDPEVIARRYRDGELALLDLVRRYGVIVDWGTGELLPRTTETYRTTLRKRSATYW